MKKLPLFCSGAIIFFVCAGFVAAFSQTRNDVFVDKQGVMRWGATKREVYGFGVNYTANFAHAYRSAKKLGVDLEKAISDDVYHFSRLGFDAFRVHVWDTEISDSAGNLLDNDKLRLFDFLLSELKARGIKIFLTPIAFWGNGYPERDEKTPGFSFKYGKDACLVNADAIKAQENYLFQFLNHVNRYTNVAYKNDPDVVGFEISNEPHHKGTPEEVKAYISRMVASMRKTGCRKPILYNVSHSVHLSDAYYSAGIDGGTFQWYPTGLGARHELRGNFLPNVDEYKIPFANDPKFRSKAKIVYEFDAADVGRSYIYPAMARTFRKAGIQWATHFAYDPTFLAYANTEYNTHYMNLAYTPQKAIGLKIGGEVFHRVPLYHDYGRYPDNNYFDGFKVSYEDDLAELNAETKFFYTNHTSSQPTNAANLTEISGCGNSPIVRYEGTGAYFLDKIEPGVWRLEVLPDVVWVDNVFGKTSLRKEVAVINWRQWPMQVSLPDLLRDFKVEPLTSPLEKVVANGNTFRVSPGVYLLVRQGVTHSIAADSKFRNIRMNEFAAPAPSLKKDYLLHEPSRQIAHGRPLTIETTIVTRNDSCVVELHVQNGFRDFRLPVKRVSGYKYAATIPSDFVATGYLSYHITVTSGGVTTTYPSDTEGSPSQWDFAGSPFTIPVVNDTSDLYIFNAASDAREVSREWRRGSTTMPVGGNDAVIVVNLDKLFQRDGENPNGPVINDYSLRYNFAPYARGRHDDLNDFTKIVVRGKANRAALPVQVALIDSAGNAYGGLVTLSDSLADQAIDISRLAPVKLVSLPRPYPTFLSYFFERTAQGPLNMARVETIQISLGPGLDPADSGYSLAIESVRLMKK
ncbi:MAG TPA: cellulase family glycosylhydrolase [Chryseosolibacter sp.]|nr:cellulase family glycosylhydrolase [Chryseosolibacter sp.]